MTNASNSANATKNRRFKPSWRTLALILILLLAGFLRLWRLDQLPPGLYHDEAYNGLDALALLDGDVFPNFYEGWELYRFDAHADRPINETTKPLFFEGNFGREPLHIYLMALSIGLLGESPVAVRVVPALAGVLAVLATFLAADALFKGGVGKRPRKGEHAGIELRSVGPLLAAFTMAVLYPAITFSRFGVRAMLFVPIGTLAVFFFWKGISKAENHEIIETTLGRITHSPLPLGKFVPIWFILGGLFLGLGLYTYAAARLMPFLFAIYVGGWFIRVREARSQQWANMVIMALVAFLLALPLLLFFLSYPYFFVFRSRFVANRGAGTYPGQPWITWSLNIGRVFRGFLWEGESNLRHNLPGRPYLDLIQIILAILGLVNLFVRRIGRRGIFLLLWLGLMLLPSILSGDAPHFGRLIGAAPPLSILIAMGGVLLANQIGRIGRLSDETARRIAAGLLVILFLASAFLSYRAYFHDYARHPGLADAFDVQDWQLGQFAAALPEDTVVYLSPTQVQMATIYFALDGEIDRLRSFFSPENLMPVGDPGQEALYLVKDGTEAILDRLATAYPAGRLDSTQPGFFTFTIPAGTPRLANDELLDITWGGAISLAAWSAEQDGNKLAVTLAWRPMVPLRRDYTAFVHLLDENGNLVGQLDRPPEGYPTTDWRTGEIIIDRFLVDLTPELPAATYTLQTGFYHLPSSERLGEPVQLGEVPLISLDNEE